VNENANVNNYLICTDIVTDTLVELITRTSYY